MTQENGNVADEGLEPAGEQGMPDDVESLQKALAEERERAESYLANWQRIQADFINFKKRSEQEMGERTGQANAVLVLSLLPVIDDLERALDSVPEHLAESTLADGVRQDGV